MAAISNILLIFLAAALRGTDAATDLTVTAQATGTDVVQAAIDLIHQSCIFANDRLMLRRIAAVETDDGNDARTFVRNGVDFYGGIWQIDEQRFETTKVSARAAIYNQIKTQFNVDWQIIKYTELWKPLYSGLAAMLLINSSFSATGLPQNIQSQARYWARNYTSNSWGNETDAVKLYVAASNRTALRCSSPKADVIFLLDSSGSIMADNFDKVRQFVVDVIGSFVIGSNNVRVSVVQFSDEAQTEFNLTTYNTTAQLVNATYRIPYLSQGTATNLGLLAMETVIVSQGRFNESVPVIAIVMTDGQSNDRPATLDVAKRIHQELDDKAVIYSIGVGSGVIMDELEAIASAPSCQYVFLLTSFNDITAFSYQILKSACRAQARVPEDQAVSGVVQRGEQYYFKASVMKQKSSVEITIKTPPESAVKIYVSWNVQNPSSAIHDYTTEVNGTKDPEVSLVVPWPADDSSSRRVRRDVGANSTNSNATRLTLYGTVEGVGESDNGFELVYVISDRQVLAASTPDTSTQATSTPATATVPTSDNSTATKSTLLPSTTSAAASGVKRLQLLLALLPALLLSLRH